MATISFQVSSYNVIPTPADDSGISRGWYGNVFVSGVTTVISNANASASSVIIISPLAATGGATYPPVISAQAAGSFTITWDNRPAVPVLNYLILS